MKYLKKYEGFREYDYNHEFVGDYACADTMDTNEESRKFMQNNVGIITQYYEPHNRFRVQYTNVPAEVDLNSDFSYWFESDEILYHSKDKQECIEKMEMLRDTNKYNL